MASQADAIRRARAAIRAVKALEKATLLDVRVALSEARADLIARVAAVARAPGSVSEFDQSQLFAMLQEVDRVSSDLERGLHGAVMPAQERARVLAEEKFAANLKAQGIDPAMLRPVISVGTAVVAQSEAVASEIVGVSAEFKNAVRRDLRRAVLGGLTLRDFEQRVGRALPGPGPFGSVARRAEVIVRNETSQMFQVASQAKREEAAEAGVTFRKTWVTARDVRVRLSHVALDGVTVDADADFEVGGFPAAYPKDPRLPPEESIACRCVTIETSVEVAEPAGISTG